MHCTYSTYYALVLNFHYLTSLCELGPWPHKELDQQGAKGPDVSLEGDPFWEDLITGHGKGHLEKGKDKSKEAALQAHYFIL